MGILRKAVRVVRQAPHVVKKVALSAPHTPRAIARTIDPRVGLIRTRNTIQYTKQFGVAYAQGIRAGITDFKKRPVVGGVRLAASVYPYSAVALMAYDAKRLRDRTRAAESKYRVITKQALIDQAAVTGRIKVLNGYTQVTPLYSQVVPPPDIALSPALENDQNVALPAATTESDVMPGPGAIGLAAPTPDQRGAGGDAAEGTSAVLAGAGASRAGISWFLVIGLLGAAYVAWRGMK